MPANKALGAHEEVKKDLVDILNMYMPANLNQIPAYMQPKRLYTVQSTIVHTKHNKALAAPKAVKVERCQRSRYTKSHKGLAGGATRTQKGALLEASRGEKTRTQRCQRQLLTRKDYSCPRFFVVVQPGPTSRVVGTLPLVNWIFCPDTAKSSF